MVIKPSLTGAPTATHDARQIKKTFCELPITAPQKVLIFRPWAASLTSRIAFLMRPSWRLVQILTVREDDLLPFW